VTAKSLKPIPQPELVMHTTILVLGALILIGALIGFYRSFWRTQEKGWSDQGDGYGITGGGDGHDSGGHGGAEGGGH
jgi:hypothetical protein